MHLIPSETLAKAKKILFIAHLAIGDFTYLQNFFKAFAEAHPQLKVDLWIDEVRCTSDSSQWGFLKNYSLYDWTENCSFFHKVYRRTYSPALLQESIHEAQQENYPLVVSLATLRPHKYAKLAREVGGPNALIIGMKGKARWFAPWDNSAYAKLDASFAPFVRPSSGHHITEVYADWFKQLCGLQVTTQQRFPFVSIPTQWTDYAKQQLQEWGVTEEATNTGQQVVFINSYAKTKKRCWPLASVAELIVSMRALPAWRDSVFIVNAVPQEIDNARTVLASYHLTDTHLFSAEQNFFQLPAILQRCDLIISVETAVMHLANAVHVPVIALMRQKNPEWVPLDSNNSTVITTRRRREWVNAIPVEEIIKAITQ
ncbi:glycosyltransferase family 9 protein [Solimicrobium silvestre]|uniref:Glycosyltransferase family 9 (Heptosyltransferase) n=1 Tax=Solimicrobium silvestre TaxID=2099400 RepID=A0A2S9GYL7_9BURK|nr:glycosyltransferase family 9 protein [Solimicrobium silvestre]PRC92814.1 Glycosyltransferase family 9 (heptosyltransferase) [Solimicrobium silvestre]